MPTEIKHLPEIRQNQPVQSNANVLLSILIGNGQIGGSFVQDQDGNQVAKGTITNLNIGKGSSLIGKSISVFTNVLDVNDEDPDNGVIITHRFTNTKQSYRYPSEGTIKISDGGIVVLTVIYTFISA